MTCICTKRRKSVAAVVSHAGHRSDPERCASSQRIDGENRLVKIETELAVKAVFEDMFHYQLALNPCSHVTQATEEGRNIWQESQFMVLVASDAL